MKVTGNVKYIPAGVTEYVIDGNDGEINVDTSTSAITLILPNIVNSGYENSDKGFIINDISNNAGTNNITIVAANNTVNSQSSVLIMVNGGTAKCSIANQTEWFVITEPSVSGSSGFTQIEYLDLVALKAAGTLVEGQTYLITDRYNYQSGGVAGVPNPTFSGDDRGYVYITALSISTFNKNVTRLMACPKYYDSSVHGGYSWKGVWALSKSVVVDDLIIWGANVWQNKTGSIGTATNEFVLDGVNWELLTKEFYAELYQDKQFSAYYDINSDWFDFQSDKFCNECGVAFDVGQYNYTLTYNPCDITDWNFMSGRESASVFSRNSYPLGMYNNTDSYIEGNNHYYGSLSNNDTAFGIWNNQNSDIYGNVVSTIYDNTIDSIIGISDATFTMTGNSLSNTGFGLDKIFEIDITGQTNVNLTSYFPKNLIRNIKLVTTNPTETIDTFTNYTNSSTTNVIANIIVSKTSSVTINPSGGIFLRGGVPFVIVGGNRGFIKLESKQTSDFPGQSLVMVGGENH